MDARYTVAAIGQKKQAGEKLVMLTAYDYPIAALADQSGADMILVGDSLGMVVMGYDTTIPVTLEDMLHHVKAAAKGVKKAMLVADMPYGYCQMGLDATAAACVRLIQEGGACACKLEGGAEIAPMVASLTARGIPIMGHLGLLPQTTPQISGYKTQGRSQDAAAALLTAAQALEAAGVFAIVLECVEAKAAALISRRLSIPTIGIGSGNGCDGQVLVCYDMLGLTLGHTPKFVRRYADLQGEVRRAFEQYAQEVREGSFPADEHSAAAADGEIKKLY